MGHSLNCPEYITPPARQFRYTNGKKCTCGFSSRAEWQEKVEKWASQFERDPMAEGWKVMEDDDCCVVYSIAKHPKTHGFEVVWKKGRRPVWVDNTGPCFFHDYLYHALKIATEN